VSFHWLGNAPNTYKHNKTEFTEKVRQLGGTHLVALTPQHLNPGAVSLCADSQQRSLYFQEIPEKRLGLYPHDVKSNATITITQENNGILKVSGNNPAPPKLNTAHPIYWQKNQTGWLGYPNPSHPLWAICLVLLFILMTFFFWRLKVEQPNSTDQTISK
jgi:hypothetical protein